MSLQLIDDSELNLTSFDFIDKCRKVISIDSSSQASNLELAHFFKKLAFDLGLHCEIQLEIHNGVEQANIIIRALEKQNHQVDFLLQTHLDTVDPGHFPLWKKNNFNPFDAVIEDGRIYGLGAADVKLDFLCKLRSLYQFKIKNNSILKDLKLNPVLVGTFGEESGMQGALRLIRKNKINAKYALIGEPSDFNIITAAKGFATVEIDIPFSEEEVNYKINKNLAESTSTQTKIFTGQSAHSSTPHLGDSAALKLFDYLEKMPENIVIVDIDAGTRLNTLPHQAMVELDVSTSLKDPAIKKINSIIRVLNQVQLDMKLRQDLEFEPTHSTLTVGLIRTFEDRILLAGSCRILPNVKQEDYETWMSKISNVCQSVGAKFRLQDYKRPFRTSTDSVLVKAALSELKKIDKPSKSITLASTNEASLFSRVGIECVCIGAGVREDNAHVANENVKIDDLEKISIFYQNMIERFCL